MTAIAVPMRHPEAWTRRLRDVRWLLLAVLACSLGLAQEGPQTREVPGRTIQLLTGTVTLPCGAATIDVPADMVFIPFGDARHVIEVLWRNPITPNIMGMIMPKDADFLRDPAAPPQRLEKDLHADAEALPQDPAREPEPAAEAEPAAPRDDWALVITWTEGHIREQDVRHLDADAMLASMRGGLPAENAARRSQTLPCIDLLGWAVPPDYDATLHAFILSRRIAFYYGGLGQERRLDVGTQINHSIYVLGAQGFLECNAIADESALPELIQVSRSLISQTRMLPGHRHGDFRPGVDRLYQGDLAARLSTGDDPGNIQLAVRSRLWLWTIACLALAALVAAVTYVVWRDRRERKASPDQAPWLAGGVVPQPALRCPRCSQDVAADVARCPGCGASLSHRGGARP